MTELRPSSDPIPFVELVSFLKGRNDLLLLRPHDFSMSGVTGDIDLLGMVSSQEVEAHFGKPSIVVSRRYVIQRFFKWGLLDVLPELEWDGVEYLNKDEVFKEAVRGEDGILRPRLGHDAVISWLTSLLWGGFFKEKYRSVIERALVRDRDLVIEKLDEIFGRKLSQKMISLADAGEHEKSSEMVPELRRAMHAKGGVMRQLRHWYRELEFHLRPPMPFMAFLGPDGSGKSTVLEEVTAKLTARRISAHTLHWRPDILKPGAQPEGGIVEDPHGKPARGLVSSILKLCLLLADWNIGYWGEIRHKQAKSKIAISDRYFDDLLVDPVRYRYGAPLWLAKLLFRFAPQPDLVFVLHADANVIYARKQEVTFDELERQIERYRGVKEMKPEAVYLIDVDRPVEVIGEEVIVVIENWWKNNASRLP